jgi:hypothetical protein
MDFEFRKDSSLWIESSINWFFRRLTHYIISCKSSYLPRSPSSDHSDTPQPGSHCNWGERVWGNLAGEMITPAAASVWGNLSIPWNHPMSLCASKALRHRGRINEADQMFLKLSYASWSRPRKPSPLVRLGLWPLGIPQIRLSGKLTLVCENQEQQKKTIITDRNFVAQYSQQVLHFDHEVRYYL